jgi:hypothetical protein
LDVVFSACVGVRQLMQVMQLMQWLQLMQFAAP